ncbi:MAG TPA: serine hydrolase domain-containing protein [Chitinophaga sp.]|uniref:serine hydrolase domain-containing protein n=1 Tax=Chitinophaga sp. TaxID=1869181 RepID=UPI002B9BF0EA|nr:serine hydrolase domain-containing protein [Chitinophaga sp.]HVI47722.1 serine hydrolase domain-containing protein [Chitinophaga sp.]
MNRFLCAIIIVLLSIACRKNPGENQNEILKNKIETVAKTYRIPTLSVFIRNQHGEMAFRYMDNERTIAPVETYGIANATNMLVALPLLKLVENHKINLDSPVVKYLRQTSLSKKIPWMSAIKIRHLLSHTSGIPDFTRHRSWMTLLLANRAPRTYAEKIALIETPDSTQKLDRYCYSASDYVILERVVEIVTSQKGPAYFKNFYADLGLPGITLDKPSTGTQTFYAQQVGAITNNTNYSENYSYEGGAYAKAPDLALLLKKVFTDKSVLSQESLDEMLTWNDMQKYRISYSNVQIARYGGGLMQCEMRDQQYIGHAGISLKYQSFIFVDPSTGYTIIVLTNCSGKFFNNAFAVEIIDKLIAQQ